MIEITPQYLASQGLSETFPKRFWSKVDKNGPTPKHRPELGQCWIWTAALTSIGPSCTGYGTIQKGVAGAGLIRANRASWILNVGPIIDCLDVLHKCDTSKCVNPSHLFLGNHEDNMRDAWMKGRIGWHFPDNRGSENGNSKLNSTDVLKIRQMRESGHTLKSIGVEFGVTEQNVWWICSGLTWKHVMAF